MAFQALVVLVGLATGWLKKGSLWSLTNIRLRWIWIAPIAYILQRMSIRHFVGATYEVTVLVSYVALVVFCVVNLRTSGIRWALAGITSNLLVMVANGLRMPAYLPAVQKLEPWLIPMLKKDLVGKSVAMSAHTHLNLLGDIFLFNVWPQSIISVGDILFGIGLAILIYNGMTSNRGGEGSRNGTREAIS